uniref:Saxiphilin-like n=1 Tax=Oncorhynchus kisutch TaxID=8019 RepID=A0A8C7G458_ONCKI
MAILTIILLVSTAFALGDGMIRPKTPCEIARDTAMKNVRPGVYVPMCDNDGQYKPEQCSGSTGYCWCVTSTGQKIQDGTIRPKTPCEDARDAATHDPIGAYIPTCDAAGRYTPEQCSGSTGYCWCVNSSGQKIQGTETPPGTAINCSTKVCIYIFIH